MRQIPPSIDTSHSSYCCSPQILQMPLSSQICFVAICGGSAQAAWLSLDLWCWDISPTAVLRLLGSCLRQDIASASHPCDSSFFVVRWVQTQHRSLPCSTAFSQEKQPIVLWDQRLLSNMLVPVKRVSAACCAMTPSSCHVAVLWWLATKQVGLSNAACRNA